MTTLSLISFEDYDDEQIFLFEHVDKVAHFTFYFGFVLLGAFCYKENWSEKPLDSVLLKIVVVAVAYSILIEFVQEVMPTHRSAEIFDVFANALGASLAGLLIKKYYSLIPWLK